MNLKISLLLKDKLNRENDENYTMDIIHAKYGKVGVIVTNQRICGRSCGGVRIFSEEIKIDELEKLAESMTLKLGFLKIEPRGGCKIGILSQRDTDRAELFKGIGNFLKYHLKRNLLALGVDLGTDENDIRFIYKGAGFRNRNTPFLNTSFFTAKGIFIALDVVRELLNLNNRTLNIAIEGFGKVGAEIAKLSLKNNCNIIGISNKYSALYNPKGLNSDILIEKRLQYQDEFIFDYREADKIPNYDLFSLPGIDVLIPCAGIYTLSSEIASRIKVKAILPASNLAADENARRILFNRNILYVPDFIANSGGILGSFLTNLSLHKSSIDGVFYNNFKERIRNYLVGAHNSRMEPFSYSKTLALKNFFEMKNGFENSFKGKILKSRFFNYLKGKRIPKILARSYLLRKLI